MRLEYVDTPSGQLHLRRHGAGDPLVLLHWAPASGRMYEAALPHFASQGFESLALDLPGYGRSHKHAAGWSIPQHAANLLEALDALGVGRFDLVGGHLSASIAVAMALAVPSRIGRLVLDGLLNLEAEEWNDLLHRFAGKSPRIRADGAHRAFPFDMVVSTLQEWNPAFALDEGTLPQVYALLNDYLEMGLVPMREFVEPSPDRVVEPYPLAASLARLGVPTLVLSADEEPLKPAFRRSVAAIPGALGHVFPGTHPLVSGRDAEYALAIARFLRPRRT